MARNKNQKDSHRFYIWLDNAQEDLIAAELLIINSRCNKLVAFHCQQNLEKALKSYILFKENILLEGHNLLWLCRQAAKIDPDFFNFLDECAALNHSYIETRYPSDLMFEISEKQIRKFFVLTKKTFENICRKIYNDYKSGSIKNSKYLR